MTVRVLLADDQALLRGAFRVLIDTEDDMEVVAEASDGREALEKAKVTRPDLVLMDVRMPGTDGLSATTAICGDPDLADTRVLILTTFETDEHVARALGGGAVGFLAQPDPVPERAALPERLASLTAREREVMAMAATGLSNEEIAARMYVSPFTVRTHVHRAMAELDARDRAQLVTIAYRSGLVRAPHPPE